MLYEQNRVKIFLRIAGTEHEKSHNKYLQHIFSVKLVFTEADMVRSVYYTSDTRYQKSVGNLAKDSDIVIANISSVYEEDILKAMYITVKMYPCSGGTDTGSPEL